MTSRPDPTRRSHATRRAHTKSLFAFAFAPFRSQNKRATAACGRASGTTAEHFDFGRREEDEVGGVDAVRADTVEPNTAEMINPVVLIDGECVAVACQRKQPRGAKLSDGRLAWTEDRHPRLGTL